MMDFGDGVLYGSPSTGLYGMTFNRAVLFFKSLANSRDDAPVDVRGKLKSYADDLNLTHETMYRAIRQLESEGRIERLANGLFRVV